jgi:hypothetical protein
MAAPLRTDSRPPTFVTAPAGRSTAPLDITRAPLSIRTLPGQTLAGQTLTGQILTGRGATRLRQGSGGQAGGQQRAQVDPVDRVRGEFIEMRGFSPTRAQAVRLFALSPDECDRILARLVTEGFLRQSADGRYRTAIP